MFNMSWRSFAVLLWITTSVFALPISSIVKVAASPHHLELWLNGSGRRIARSGAAPPWSTSMWTFDHSGVPTGAFPFPFPTGSRADFPFDTATAAAVTPTNNEGDVSSTTVSETITSLASDTTITRIETFSPTSSSGSPTSSSSSPTPSSSTASIVHGNGMSTRTGTDSHLGAIVGGAVGGACTLLLALCLLVFYRRRSHQSSQDVEPYQIKLETVYDEDVFAPAPMSRKAAYLDEVRPHTPSSTPSPPSTTPSRGIYEAAHAASATATPPENRRERALDAESDGLRGEVTQLRAEMVRVRELLHEAHAPPGYEEMQNVVIEHPSIP